MKYMTVLYLIVIMILNFSCTENRNSNNTIKQNKIKLTNVTDTLKFKSGIRSILQDSKGNYWFGSDQEGVCKYDGKTFTYYTSENGFCGKQVIYIKEDETGQIWFGTSSGLCCFDGNKFTADRNDSPTNILGHEQQDTWSINGTDLWFPGKNQNELIRIDKGKIHTIKYPIQISSKGNSIDYGIIGFSKSKNGGLWVAHYSGVSYYDGKAIQFINDSTMHYDGKSKYMHVRSILEDSKGRLWIGNNGIGVQLKDKDFIIHFSEKHDLVHGDIFAFPGLPGTLMHVFAIKEDSKGNIWFGDRDTGAWRFDGKEMKNFKLDTNLNTQHIWDIFEDKSGNLLFASGDRGVYMFNGNGFDRVF
jgi:ligand-binding sensor domain-containing protein